LRDIITETSYSCKCFTSIWFTSYANAIINLVIEMLIIRLKNSQVKKTSRGLLFSLKCNLFWALQNAACMLVTAIGWGLESPLRIVSSSPLASSIGQHHWICTIFTNISNVYLMVSKLKQQPSSYIFLSRVWLWFYNFLSCLTQKFASSTNYSLR
jgi:hypothetical protein